MFIIFQFRYKINKLQINIIFVFILSDAPYPTRLPGYAFDEQSNSLIGTFAPLFKSRTNVIFQGANISWVSSDSRADCLNDSCFGGPRLLQLDQADINFSIMDFQLLDSVQPNITLTVPLVEASCIFLTHYQSNLNQHPEASRTSQRLLIANFHTDLAVADKQNPVHDLQDILNYNLTGIVCEASSCYKSLQHSSHKNKKQLLSSFIVMKYYLDLPLILDKLTDFTYLGQDWELDRVKKDLISYRESDSSCSKFTDPEAYEHTASFDKSHGAMLVNANSPAKSFILCRYYIALESRIYSQIYKRLYPSNAEHFRRKCHQKTKNYSQFVFNPMVGRNYHLILTTIALVQLISTIIFGVELFVSRNWTLKCSRIFPNQV
uniref:Uncharacterized protein n=1 Tax=Tetranychus urticae TaxID=32264 RepID=T1KSH4_TETUR